MAGHSRWEDVRRGAGKPGYRVRVEPPAYRPPYCGVCGKRLRWWQRRVGWGPLGFTAKTADVLWHLKCVED